MPKVSEFFGISIYFYYNDHAPPHFHAKYQGEDAVFELRTLAVTEGQLSPRVRALVGEWAVQHLPELNRAWEQCRSGQEPTPIRPLE